MGALAGVLIPAAVGLGLRGIQAWLRRRFGAAAAAAIGARAILAAGVLVVLLLGQVLRRGVEPPRLAWIAVGRTTAIDWITRLDALALLIGGAGLLALLLAAPVGLAAGSGAGARPHARAGLAAGGALIAAAAGTLWQAAIGVALAVMACGAWPEGPERAGRVDRAWPIGLVALGAAAAALAWLAGAGDLELGTIERAALLQGRSELALGRVGGPFGGASAAAIGGAGIVAAALAWALAWPRMLARAWADGPAAAAVVAAAAAPVLLVVALRTHVALALAPAAMAALVASASGLAAVAGIRAAREGTVAERVGSIGQVVLGISAASIGIGAFIPAAQLLVAGGLGVSALVVALASGSRRAALAAAAVSAIGVAVPLAGAVAGLWGQLSAWSPGINAIAPVLALIGAAGLAAGAREIVAGAAERGQGAGVESEDRSEGTGWTPAEAPGLLAGVALVLALAAALAGAWPLANALWPAFIASRALVGAYALGPRAEALALGPWLGALVVGAALAVGAARGRGLARAGVVERAASWRLPWGERRPAAPGRGALARLWALGERLWSRVVLGPGDERVATAAGRADVQRAALVAVAGTLAILGSVFCNPDVVVIGPTRVHPVDLGGLDAAMTGSRRASRGGTDRSEDTGAQGQGQLDRVEKAGAIEAGAGGAPGAPGPGGEGPGASGVPGPGEPRGRGALDAEAAGTPGKDGGSGAPGPGEPRGRGALDAEAAGTPGRDGGSGAPGPGEPRGAGTAGEPGGPVAPGAGVGAPGGTGSGASGQGATNMAQEADTLGQGGTNLAQEPGTAGQASEVRRDARPGGGR